MAFTAGSGKTTLMRALAGATGAGSIVDGSVKIDGKEGDERLFARLATFIEQTVCAPSGLCLFSVAHCLCFAPLSVVVMASL